MSLADACIGGACTPRAGRRRAGKRLQTTAWRSLRDPWSAWPMWCGCRH